MGRLLGTISRASTTIVLSFMLAIAALVFLAIRWPTGLAKVQDFAQAAENWITNTSLPDEYNVWVNFLVDDQSLTFMMFTILSRAVLAIVLSLLMLPFGKRKDRY